jgi:chaperonin GroES
MAFRPLYDRVLVKRIEAEERSSGGLFIPDSAKEKPQQAEVVAVGNGRRLKNGEIRGLEVKPGDRILFGKYSGDEIKLEGVDHLILREDDILAIVEA